MTAKDQPFPYRASWLLIPDTLPGEPGEQEAWKKMAARMRRSDIPFEEAVYQEHKRASLYLDAWTRYMHRSGHPEFDARATHLRRSLRLGSLNTGYLLITDQRLAQHLNIHGYDFLSQRVKSTRHEECKIVHPVIVLESEAVDLLRRYGGQKTGHGSKLWKDILTCYRTVADVGDHDYIHASVAPGDIESHALVTHAKILEQIFEENPRVKQRIYQISERFFRLVKQFKDTMESAGVDDEKATKTCDYLCNIYLQRFSRYPIAYKEVAARLSASYDAIGLPEKTVSLRQVYKRLCADDNSKYFSRWVVRRLPKVYTDKGWLKLLLSGGVVKGIEATLLSDVMQTRGKRMCLAGVGEMLYASDSPEIVTADEARGECSRPTSSASSVIMPGDYQDYVERRRHPSSPERGR